MIFSQQIWDRPNDLCGNNNAGESIADIVVEDAILVELKSGRNPIHPVIVERHVTVILWASCDVVSTKSTDATFPSRNFNAKPRPILPHEIHQHAEARCRHPNEDQKHEHYRDHGTRQLQRPMTPCYATGRLRSRLACGHSFGFLFAKLGLEDLARRAQWK